jgi:hypothetical protein
MHWEIDPLSALHQMKTNINWKDDLGSMRANLHVYV